MKHAAGCISTWITSNSILSLYNSNVTVILNFIRLLSTFRNHSISMGFHVQRLHDLYKNKLAGSYTNERGLTSPGSVFHGNPSAPANGK